MLFDIRKSALALTEGWPCENPRPRRLASSTLAAAGLFIFVLWRLLRSGPMEIKFADLQVYASAENDVVLKQFCYGEDDQIISFPPHQAKAICNAIMQVAKKAE
jgi:hypothetical protein